jgi:DnaJ like chaperone protein
LYKFIFAFAGFIIFRSWGVAILGFIIGSLFDKNERNKAKTRSSRYRNMNTDDVFNYYQQQSTGVHEIQTMLMALSAAVMKADGKVLKAELDYVKAFFINQFGTHFQKQQLQTLKQFLDASSIPLNEICSDIRNRMQPEVRIQLIHYLFGIAKADGDVSTSEMQLIERISNLLGVPTMEFESVKNMFYRNVNSDYKILGIEEFASDEEVKKAYRKMAITFHPDKVASMGEEYQKGAKEKFQKIQEAYEAIKKRRGMK